MMRAQQMGQGSVGPYRLLPPLCAMLVASGKGGRRTALALQARSCGGADGGEPIPCCNLVALTCQLPYSQRRSRKVLRPWRFRRSKQRAGKAPAAPGGSASGGRSRAAPPHAAARPCPLAPPLFRPAGGSNDHPRGLRPLRCRPRVERAGEAPAAAGRAQRRRSAAARICGPPPPLSALGESGEDLR